MSPIYGFLGAPAPTFGRWRAGEVSLGTQIRHTNSAAAAAHFVDCRRSLSPAGSDFKDLVGAAYSKGYRSPAGLIYPLCFRSLRRSPPKDESARYKPFEAVGRVGKSASLRIPTTHALCGPVWKVRVSGSSRVCVSDLCAQRHFGVHAAPKSVRGPPASACKHVV